MQQGDAFDEGNFFKVERVDGSVYEGPLDKDKEPHGKGVEKRNGGEYEYHGDWVHGAKQGDGMERDSLKGEEYVGDFHANLRHGKGKLVRGDGYEYEGDWAQNLPHGEGREKYQTGD